MTRDAEHAEAIRRCTTVAECHAWRAKQGELTSAIYMALLMRIAALRKLEGKQPNPWAST